MTKQRIVEIKSDLLALCQKHHIAIHADMEDSNIAIFTPGPFLGGVPPKPNYFLLKIVKPTGIIEPDICNNCGGYTDHSVCPAKDDEDINATD